MRRRVQSVLAAAVLCLVGCAPEPVARLEWTTMGTVAAVQVRGKDADAAVRSVRDAVKRVFDAVEGRLNAHDPGSELRRLAALPEAEILSRCDASVSNCYAAAFRLMRETGGAFSPRWRGPGTLDLGAIAKGYAVDLAAEALASAPADGVADGAILIDLGGNLKSVRGVWRVGIAGSEETLDLSEGMACATSAEYFRGKHIRDGRTGRAVTNGVASVTVVHPQSATLADGLSTTLFVLGREAGEHFLREHHPAARALWF